MRLIAAMLLSTLGAAASSTGGTGASSVCAGGQPQLCARLDLATVTPTVPVLSGATGSLNVVKQDDMGERVVRLTDSNTVPLQFGCCAGNSSAEQFEWSLFDATLFGGGGGWRVYTIDG